MLKGYRRLQGIQNITKMYSGLQGVTWGYKGFHGGYEVLQRLKRLTGKYDRLLRV